MTRANLHILIFVILMVALGQLSNTIFFVSLPYMKIHFGVEKETVMLSVILSLISFGLSQLIYGPFSDFYGRKPVLLFGLLVFSIGSLICFTGQNILLFLCGRVVQGLGIGCVGPICRAIVRDTQSTDDTILKYMGCVTMLLSIMPLFSPVIGGLIQSTFGWRYNFLFLFVYVIIFIFFIKFFMPETCIKIRNSALDVDYYINSFYELIFNYIFIRFVMLNMLAYSGDLIFASDYSFLLQDKLKYNSKVFAFTAAIFAAFLFIGNCLTARFSKNFTSAQFTVFGAFLMFFGSAMLLIFSKCIDINYFSLVLPMLFFSLGEGLLVPSSNAGAMSAIINKVGLAGSFVGFTAMFGAGVMMALFGFFDIKTELGLSFFLITISIAALLISYYNIRGVGNVFCKT